jgi:hypothetical protein
MQESVRQLRVFRMIYTCRIAGDTQRLVVEMGPVGIAIIATNGITFILSLVIIGIGGALLNTVRFQIPCHTPLPSSL